MSDRRPALITDHPEPSTHAEPRSSSRPPAEDLPLVLYGDTLRFPDIYHQTRFLTPDPFIVVELRGERIVGIKSLEQRRAQHESTATSVRSFDELGGRGFMAAGLPADAVAAAMIHRLLAELGVDRVAVPSFFPIGVAEGLRERGVRLVISPDLGERRRGKSAAEIAAIEVTQRATEDALTAAIDALRAAQIASDGRLVLEGRTFTAERLRAIIEHALLERGCRIEITIAAPGTQAADPHGVGSGPIRAGEAIVIDIAPQHAESRYFADMTRTVSKELPAPAILRMYDVVRQAQDAAIAAIRPGITGLAIHELVEDIIFDAGYDTLRPTQRRHVADGIPRGFIHGTGHGVGLEVHEAPVIGPAGLDPLRPGDVITIEPGIYDPDIGGVRLEDLLVVTEDGALNLTRAPRELVV